MCERDRKEIERHFAEKYNCNLRTGWNTMALVGADGRFRGSREEKAMYDAHTYLSRKDKDRGGR